MLVVFRAKSETPKKLNTTSCSKNNGHPNNNKNHELVD
jgi:hypothetical protein